MVAVGRPRRADLDGVILTATADLLVKGGLAAAGVDAIAARAGVGKASIYRRWSSRDDLILDALLVCTASSLKIPEQMSAVEALEFHVAELAGVLSEPRIGPLLRALTARAQADDALAGRLRERWILPRRTVARQLVDRALHEGSVDPGVDVELLLDELVAPHYFRLIYGLPALSREAVAVSVRQVLRGAGVRDHGEGASVQDLSGTTGDGH
ncbi:TetR/AcrR family transcriptional regulator [Propionibacterium sp.]|uniref:TetR/AcrR family transcriptional regulator n=1 Tax=Propionibacterium sp. TaxID=1977903 RepID=UPI0039EA1EAF